MSDFSVTTLLEVEVDQSSLRQTKQELSDEIGAATAEVSASDQLVNDSQSNPGAATSMLEDNIALNETRNDLLREILDATEMGARNRGRRLPSLGKGMLALGGGAVGVLALLSKVDWAGLVGDAIPDIQPGDVVDAAEVAASEFVGEGLPVAATDLVDDNLPIDVGAVLASTPLVSLGAILAKGEFPIKPGDILGESSGGPSGSPSGDGSPAGGGGDLPIAEAIGGGALGAGAYAAARNSGALSKLLGVSSGAAVLTPGMFENTRFGDYTKDPSDYEGVSSPTPAELLQDMFGGDTGPAATGGTRRPESSVPAGSVSPNGSFLDMARNRTGGRAPGPEVKVVTVGEDSNRNDSNRQQEVRVNGNVTVDVTADRSVEQQLRQRGLPDWIVDAVERRLGGRIG